MTEKSHIYTICSDLSKLTHLIESSHAANLDINIHKLDVWNGYVDKITTMIDILESHSETDIICFIDAYDVICYSGMDEIINKFKDSKCNILLSGEINCYPDNSLGRYKELECQMYDFLIKNGREEDHSDISPIFPTNFKYVNSGGYIGYCSDLLKMLKWKSVKEIAEMCQDGGDQNYFSIYYLEHAFDSFKRELECREKNIEPYDVIKIDTEQNIFQSMYNVKFTEFYYLNGRLHNSILNKKPCFAHFNGFNVYKYLITSLKTSSHENVYDVFLSTMKKSMLCSDVPFSLDYTIRFYITYNGKTYSNFVQVGNNEQ